LLVGRGAAQLTDLALAARNLVVVISASHVRSTVPYPGGYPLRATVGMFVGAETQTHLSSGTARLG